MTLNQQKGKAVVVYFWSDLCSCAEKLPKLNKFYRQNKDRGLVILAVNVGQTEKRVASYLKKNPLEYTVLLDEKKDTAKSYGWSDRTADGLHHRQEREDQAEAGRRVRE